MKEGFLGNWLNSNRAIYTGMAFIFLVIILWNLFYRREATQPAPDSRAQTSTAVKPSSSPNSSQPSVQRESISRSPVPSIPVPQTSDVELRIAKAKNDLFSDRVSQLATKCETTSAQISSLSSRIKELETNDAGRKIAPVSNLVKSFVSYRDLAKKLDERLTSVRGEITLYKLEIERAVLEHPELIIPDSLKSQLQKLSDSVDEISNSIDTKRIGLAAIVDESNKLEISNMTLLNAIEKIAIEDQKRLVESNNVKRDMELQAKTDEVGKAKHDKAMAELDAKRAQLESVKLALKAKEKADEIAAKAAQERVLLEAEFQKDFPKINHYLGALFKKTTKQPGGGVTIEMDESTPVSLSALQKTGVNHPDVRKACGSLLLFFSYFNAGGRGMGPYQPNYHGARLDDTQLATIRPAYDLLKKYGLLLVEKGLLAE